MQEKAVPGSSEGHGVTALNSFNCQCLGGFIKKNLTFADSFGLSFCLSKIGAAFLFLLSPPGLVHRKKFLLGTVDHWLGKC